MPKSFPVATLLTQFVRQITTPLSKKIVKRVRQHEFVREKILIRLGHFYQWCETKALQIAKHETKEEEPPKKEKLDDLRAMELGTQMLLELLVFAFLGVAVYYEASRTAERVRRIEAEVANEMNNLGAQKDQLVERVQRQSVEIQDLKAAIVACMENIVLPVASSDISDNAKRPSA